MSEYSNNNFEQVTSLSSYPLAFNNGDNSIINSNNNNRKKNKQKIKFFTDRNTQLLLQNNKPLPILNSQSSLITKRQHLIVEENAFHQCEQCGKVYKHRNCLSKHRWEHHESWELTKRICATKHQQVQMLEAAQVLLEMQISYLEIDYSYNGYNENSSSVASDGYRDENEENKEPIYKNKRKFK